jgi:hypothetical protein
MQTAHPEAVTGSIVATAFASRQSTAPQLAQPLERRTRFTLVASAHHLQARRQPMQRPTDWEALVAWGVLRISWWLNHLVPPRIFEELPDTGRNVTEHEVLIENGFDHVLVVERSWTA